MEKVNMEQLRSGGSLCSLKQRYQHRMAYSRHCSRSSDEKMSRELMEFFIDDWMRMMTLTPQLQWNKNLALLELDWSWLGTFLVMLAGNKGSCTVMGRPCWWHLLACLAKSEVALG